MFTLCQHGCRGLSQMPLPPKAVVAVVGLDLAGKSSVIAVMKREPLDDVSPMTIFMPEEVKVGKCEITLMDLGGHGTRRDLWPTYFAEIQGVIFVVDSSDRERVALAKDVLEKAMAHKYMRGKRVLVLANKQDVVGAMSAEEVASRLNIHPDDGQYYVKPCSAASNEGSKPAHDLQVGFRWLLNSFLEDEATLAPRVEAETEEWREVEREERRLKRERVRLVREERERKQEAADAAEAAALAAAGGDRGDRGGGEGGGGAQASAASQTNADFAAAHTRVAQIIDNKLETGAISIEEHAHMQTVNAAAAVDGAKNASKHPATAPAPAPAPAPVVAAGASSKADLFAAGNQPTGEAAAGEKKKARRKKKQKVKKNQVRPAENDDEDLPHAHNTSSA